MNVAVAIIDAALERLWDGDESVKGKDRFSCHAVMSGFCVLKGEMTCGSFWGDSMNHPEVRNIHLRIRTYLNGNAVAESYVRDELEDYKLADDEVGMQAFRKQMLLDIRKELEC